MEAQLQELIDKIKKDGVETAEQEADKIISEAKGKAESIISDAENKAKEIVSKAKKDIQQQESSSKEGLVQAGRDVILALEKKITKVFDEVIGSGVSEAMTGKTLEELIVTMVSEWIKKESADLTVLLSEKDLTGIESSLRKRLSSELKKGVEIKVSDTVKSGFLIGEKDGSAYYNFSGQGIAEIIAEFVNPKLAEAIQRAAELG